MTGAEGFVRALVIAVPLAALIAWVLVRYIRVSVTVIPEPSPPPRCERCGLLEGALIPGSDPPTPMRLSMLTGDQLDTSPPNDLEIIALSGGLPVRPRYLPRKLCPSCVGCESRRR